MAGGKKINPRTRVKKKVYAEALRAVNAIRTKLGEKALKSLPSGIPGDGDSCPLAYALKPFTPEVSGAGVDLLVEVNNPFGGNPETFEGTASDLGVDDSVFDEFVQQFDTSPAEAKKEAQRRRDEAIMYTAGKAGAAAYARVNGYARQY